MVAKWRGRELPPPLVVGEPDTDIELKLCTYACRDMTMIRRTATFEEKMAIIY